MRKRTKGLIHFGVGIFIAGVLLYLAIHKIDPKLFWINLKSVDLRYFIPMLIIVFIFFWLKVIRWTWLLRPIRGLSIRDVLPAFMIGSMGNNVLPARLGELPRIYILAKQFQLSKASILSTIILERVLDFMSIIGLFALTVQFIPLAKEFKLFQISVYLIALLCIIVFILFILYAWQTDYALQVTQKVLFIAPSKFREKALEITGLLVHGLSSLRSPRLLVAIICVTVTHWLINAIGLYFAIISFPLENPLPLLAAFFLMAILGLGAILPSAPGYLGTFQYSFVIALGVFGVSSETALAASFYAFFTGYLPVTLTGFYFLARLGLKLSTLNKQVKAAQDDDL